MVVPSSLISKGSIVCTTSAKDCAAKQENIPSYDPISNTDLNFSTGRL